MTALIPLEHKTVISAADSRIGRAKIARIVRTSTNPIERLNFMVSPIPF
jgi:hypothetical protein